jgi:hypothetical protein
MFSRDGTRLAIGGGSWYGEGGILLVDLASGETSLFPCADLPSGAEERRGVPTVSGVCFSPDDRHLAASTWTSRHHYGPTCLFEVSGRDLKHRDTLDHDYRDDIGDPCPTGVLLWDQLVVTRNNCALVGDVFALWRSPPYLRAEAGIPQHLTSSNLVVVRETAITGGGGTGLSEWRTDLGGRELGKAVDGLVALPLTGDTAGPEVFAVQQCRRVTAIGAVPSGAGFLTGGLDGELDAWSWDGRWEQSRLKPPTEGTQRATYTEQSVIGICHLPDGGRWVSANAGGGVCLWEGVNLLSTWQLPERGSPRSLAAHPDRPWIAVGVKKGGFARPQSAVVIVEVDPLTLDPNWRTPTVLGLARAAEGERISPDGPLDPARLAILADALEDAGCADGRLLAHLRNHDGRLNDCWVVAGLLGKGPHQSPHS